MNVYTVHQKILILVKGKLITVNIEMFDGKNPINITIQHATGRDVLPVYSRGAR